MEIWYIVRCLTTFSYPEHRCTKIQNVLHSCNKCATQDSHPIYMNNVPCTCAEYTCKANKISSCFVQFQHEKRMIHFVNSMETQTQCQQKINGSIEWKHLKNSKCLKWVMEIVWKLKIISHCWECVNWYVCLSSLCRMLCDPN